jgi:tetratricopeptide (TPR) repeat protein
MASQAKKIARKDLLKNEDEFLTLSARTILYVRDHAKAFQYAGLAVVALIVVYMGIYAYLGHVDKKGQAAYNEGFYALEGSLNSKQDPEKMKSIEESFRKVIDQYSLSDASSLAYPELAQLKFTEKKYGEAIPLYTQFLEKAPGDSPYRSMAMLALAGCYEGAGDSEKALDLLKRITTGPEGPAKQLAVMNLARVYRLTGQMDKSKETLNEFAAKYKTSPFLPMVQAQIAKDLS